MAHKGKMYCLWIFDGNRFNIGRENLKTDLKPTFHDCKKPIAKPVSRQTLTLVDLSEYVNVK